MKQNEIKVGSKIKVRNFDCKIVKLLPLGTVEVESLDGLRHFRVSGLTLGKPLARACY